MSKKNDVEVSKKDVNIEELMKDVEIRSEAVQEIMGYIPRWIIRWGITVIFAVVILILIGSYFFKYPDIIPAQITLTTEHPPSTLVARSSGKITELFVQDKQKVQEGDPIAIIENATNHGHLFELKEKLESLRPVFNDYDNPLPVILFDRYYSLGQLQSSYATFLSAYEDYQYFLNNDYHRKQIVYYKDQIAQRNTIISGLELQMRNLEKELKLARDEYERQKALYKEQLISRSQFDAAEGAMLSKESGYEIAKGNLTGTRLQISQLEQQMLDMEQSYRDDKQRRQLALKQAYDNLNGQIAQWEQAFLLKAPISGTVTFTRFWSVNQNVNPGDKVVTIVPEEGGEIIGKVILPIAGSGKVKLGQRVNIKFINYPYMDYGIVSGQVTSRSLVAADNAYSLEVHLPNGMRTSYNKELEFAQEMQGTAEIITEDIRLLERIFKPIKNLLTKIEEKKEVEQK
jgi:multidrug resistance efflux pump